MQPAETALTVTDTTGRFMFVGVPSGHYTLETVVMADEPELLEYPGRYPGMVNAVGATVRGTPEQWASVPVTVATSDVQSLRVPLHPPLTVSGSIAYAPVGTSAIGDASAPASPRVVLSIESIAGDPAGHGQTMSGRDHRFIFHPLAPGRYRLDATTAEPWQVRSITLDGKDCTDRAAKALAVHVEEGRVFTANLVPLKIR